MTDYENEPRLTEDELKAEFKALFPKGWAGADVLAELAPDGWAASPLAAIFHPSVEQVFEESVRMHRNMASFPRRPDAPPEEPDPEPTLEEITADYSPTPVEPERECQELVGLCLWDVFSDNHDVSADDGRLLTLGSARASGGFLAEILNAQGGPPPQKKPPMPPELEAMMFPKSDDPKMIEMVAAMRKEMFGDGGYTYLDFYMGTGMVSGRADLQPVYEMIFRRLYNRGMDWKYSFPRLYCVDLRPLKERMDAEKRGDEPEWAGYDPSAAFEEDEVERQRDEELAEFREKLDEGHREAVEAAKDREPPTTVRAYAAVFGGFPQGWPPEV